MKVEKSKFGLLNDGSKVTLYTVSNDNMSFSVMDYGCTITAIMLNNPNGTKTDVTLGYSTLPAYINEHCFYGAVVGRFGNRIGNSKFTLNGKEYQLENNDGGNSLHGGFIGYDKMMWNAKIIKGKNGAGVKFTRTSPDGEQGYPGNLKMTVTYLLDNNNNISMTYTATTDKATPINLTNHSYFNLAGRGTIKNHIMQMNSDKIVEVDEKLIPTGNLVSVEGNAFDFREPKAIGKDIDSIGMGYDHCYVTEIYDPENPQCGLPLDDTDLVEFCTVKDPESGREMTVFTNMEGCQFYSGNFIEGCCGKSGIVYKKQEGFCLETQSFPDTPNKQNFPTCVLEPGQKMKAKTVYSFKF
ncbi:MAG: galactose mutarotase [Spirochaetia bacterium]|nr:galactose mutarotase [Spirochaetia bacterium]